MTLQPWASIPLVQGECMVSKDPFTVFTTVLGSCIAACLFDPTARIGGMNHFLLPDCDQSASGDLRYGVHSMELLINGLLKLGADRSRLKAKIFGGSHIMNSSHDIGIKNQKFIKSFLLLEGIKCLASDLGGTHARKIRFEPVSSRVHHRLIPVATISKECEGWQCERRGES